MELGEYDDDFFNALPKVFPYNTFTLKKLTKREVFPRRIQELSQLQESHIEVIKAGIAETLDTQLAEFQKVKDAWVADTQNRQRLAEERKKRVEEGGHGTPEPMANALEAQNQVSIASLPRNADTILGESSQAGSPMPVSAVAGVDGEEAEGAFPPLCI